VEFEPEEQLALFIADGRPLDEWTDSVLKDLGRSGVDVRARVASPDSMAGALICTAVVPAGGTLEPPIIIFDGWHRAAIWFEHTRRGRRYPVSAYLILTQRQASLLGRPIA
jgi:hypothetical protein